MTVKAGLSAVQQHGIELLRRDLRVAKRSMLAAAATLALMACTQSSDPQTQFARWLHSDRAVVFARFEAVLQQEGVSSVVPSHELWLVDRLRPECVAAPFVVPTEREWANIVGALRFIRDHVEPAIGDVRVVSGYRDKPFNACVGGASESAHRTYHALDLVPLDPAITREVLIERLCTLHAREGPARRIGLGIYDGVRFHIDGRSFRGWGSDHRAASFPCRAGRT